MSTNNYSFCLWQTSFLSALFCGFHCWTLCDEATCCASMVLSLLLTCVVCMQVVTGWHTTCCSGCTRSWRTTRLKYQQTCLAALLCFTAIFWPRLLLLLDFDIVIIETYKKYGSRKNALLSVNSFDISFVFVVAWSDLFCCSVKNYSLTITWCSLSIFFTNSTAGATILGFCLPLYISGVNWCYAGLLVKPVFRNLWNLR